MNAVSGAMEVSSGGKCLADDINRSFTSVEVLSSSTVIHIQIAVGYAVGIQMLLVVIYLLVGQAPELFLVCVGQCGYASNLRSQLIVSFRLKTVTSIFFCHRGGNKYLCHPQLQIRLD